MSKRLTFFTFPSIWLNRLEFRTKMVNQVPSWGRIMSTIFYGLYPNARRCLKEWLSDWHIGLKVAPLKSDKSIIFFWCILLWIAMSIPSMVIWFSPGLNRHPHKVTPQLDVSVHICPTWTQHAALLGFQQLKDSRFANTCCSSDATV
jgi:hypothetical protein